jgi:hypothetical protein
MNVFRLLPIITKKPGNSASRMICCPEDAKGRAMSEEDLLGTIENKTPQSRLSCQIVVSEELDGLVLRVPKA